MGCGASGNRYPAGVAVTGEELPELARVGVVNVATHCLARQDGGADALQCGDVRATAAGYCRLHAALAATHRLHAGAPLVWERWLPKAL